MTEPGQSKEDGPFAGLDSRIGGPVRMTIGERMAVRPSDAAFVVCGVGTMVVWSAGATASRLLLVAAVGWCLAWTWWVARRPLTVWAPLIAVGVTATVCFQQVPHVAFAAARGCLDQVAAVELDGGFDDWSDIALRNNWSNTSYRADAEPGRCGLIRWRDTYVVDATTEDGEGRAVVFAAAGQGRNIDVRNVVQHGLVRIDGGRPATCSEIVRYGGGGIFVGCDIDDLGDDWYWFSFRHRGELF